MGPLITKPAAITRRVTVGADAIVTKTDLSSEPGFLAELIGPRDGAASGGPPRSSPPYTIRWQTGLWGPLGDVPRASARITVGDATYELLGQPKTLMHGPRAVGYGASAMPVLELYPFIGNLTEQDGTVVQGDMRLAMWSPNERHDSTGEYEDYDAEAPIDYQGLIKRNRQVRMGGTTYRIMTTVVDLSVPRVMFSLRRAGG